VGLQSTYSSDQCQPCAYGSLSVAFMSLRIPEIQQHAIAHVLRDKAAKTLHGLRDTLLIGGNDFAQIFPGPCAPREPWSRPSRRTSRSLGGARPGLREKHSERPERSLGHWRAPSRSYRAAAMASRSFTR
jgi:hypothetical protein